MGRDRWLTTGAIWGPGAFIAAWVIGGLILAGYSPIRDHISNLADVNARTHDLMTLGFILYVLGAAMAIWPLRRVIGRGAAIGLAVSAVAVFWVMLTPPGVSEDTNFWHAMAALLLYFSLAVTGPLASTALWRSERLWAVASLVVGLVTILALWVSLDDSTTTSGLFQRIGLTTTQVWLMAVGIAVLARRLPSPPTIAPQR